MYKVASINEAGIGSDRRIEIDIEKGASPMPRKVSTIRIDFQKEDIELIRSIVPNISRQVTKFNKRKI